MKEANYRKTKTVKKTGHVVKAKPKGRPKGLAVPHDAVKDVLQPFCEVS